MVNSTQSKHQLSWVARIADFLFIDLKYTWWTVDRRNFKLNLASSAYSWLRRNFTVEADWVCFYKLTISLYSSWKALFCHKLFLHEGQHRVRKIKSDYAKRTVESTDCSPNCSTDQNRSKVTVSHWSVSNRFFRGRAWQNVPLCWIQPVYRVL